MSSIEVLMLANLLIVAIGFLIVFRMQARLATALREDRSHGDACDSVRDMVLLNKLEQLDAKLLAAEDHIERLNPEQLRTALTTVVADFHQRLQIQCDGQLEALTNLARSSEALLRRQRDEQMESMHHARRIADKMDGATGVFGALVSENSELLALAGQVRDALSLLGKRQGALDNDVLRQAESIEKVGAALGELRSGFQHAADDLLLQIRRSLDALAQRQSQGGSAMQKELNDSLNKAVAGISKQLSAIGPMTQQAKVQTFR